MDASGKGIAIIKLTSKMSQHGNLQQMWENKHERINTTMLVVNIYYGGVWRSSQSYFESSTLNSSNSTSWEDNFLE
jgi:hypothetical protein